MAGARDPARADVPQDRHQAEREEDVQAAPLGAEGQAQHQTGRPAPGAPAEAGGLGDVRVGAYEPVRVCRQGGRQSGTRAVAVHDQAAEGRQHEEHQHTVEQRGAAHHEVQPVHRHQRARETAQERRAEHPAPDPAQQQHRQRAEQRRHETPAERIEAEHPFAEPDDVLADRGCTT